MYGGILHHFFCILHNFFPPFYVSHHFTPGAAFSWNISAVNVNCGMKSTFYENSSFLHFRRVFLKKTNHSTGSMFLFFYSNETRHAIRLFAKSLLYTIRRYSQTTTKSLFREKILILRNTAKRGLHTIRRRPQFSQTCVEIENTTKKVLWFCQKTAYFGECNSRKSFLRNAHESDESLSTHYSRFARILSVRSFFIIVRE